MGEVDIKQASGNRGRHPRAIDGERLTSGEAKALEKHELAVMGEFESLSGLDITCCLKCEDLGGLGESGRLDHLEQAVERAE